MTITDGSTSLSEGTDYTIIYNNNVNIGINTATAKITGKGNYFGTITKTFTIYAGDISSTNATISISPDSYTYDGTAKTPAVTVTISGTPLTQDTDYTVVYSNNTSAGTATVKITGKGIYTGTATKTFTIAKASQTLTVSAASSSIFTGSTTTVAVSGAVGTVTYTSSDKTIATVSPSGVVTGQKPGTVTITVTAAGTSNYNAAAGKTVSIKVTLASCTVSSLTNATKGITVKWNQVTGATGYYVYRKTGSGSYKLIKTIKKNSTLSYTDTAVKSKNRISYTYKVVAYYSSNSSTVKSAFTAKTIVRLKTPTLSSVKNTSSKKLTVKWKKVSKVTGYQIQYSTSSSFTTSKTTTVKGYSKVSKVLSKLTKGKKYYVRIRTYYKTSSGTIYYSAWTSKKAVTVKK